MTKSTLNSALLSAALALSGAPVFAEETSQSGLSIELNAVTDAEGGCRISFLVENSYPAHITQAVYETVLFNTEGRVDRLTLFDFQELPAGRPRVREFVIPDIICNDLGRILINGVETCTGDGVPETACIDPLVLRSRTDVELVG